MHTINFKRFMPTNTMVHLVIYDDKKNKYNEFETIYEGDVMCNLQSSSYKNIEDHKLLSFNVTTIFIFDDILKNKDVINSGYVLFQGEKRVIKVGTKARDIFGNFQFIKLEFD